MIATDFVSASIKALSKGDRIVLMQLLSKPMTKANQESMIKVLFTDNLASARQSDLKRLYRAQFSKAAPFTKSATPVVVEMEETPLPSTPIAAPITEYFSMDTPQNQVQSIMQDVIRCIPKEHLNEVTSILNMPGSNVMVSILTSSVVTKIAKANPAFNGRLKALYKALTSSHPAATSPVVSAPVVSAPVVEVEESEVHYFELFSMSDDDVTDDDEDSMFSSTDVIENAFKEEIDDVEALMRRASARFMSAVLPDFVDRMEDCRASIVDLGDFVDRARASAL